MRYRFLGVEDVMPAIMLVCCELGIDVVSENEGITVNVSKR